MSRGVKFSSTHKKNLSIAQKKRFKKRQEVLKAIKRTKKLWEQGSFDGNSKAACKEMTSRWKKKTWRRKIEKVLKKNHKVIGETLRKKAALKRKQSGFLGPRFCKAQKMCWARSKGKCLSCKKRISDRRQRATHHVNLNHKDNRQKNLVALCKRCHWVYHTLLKFLPLLKLYPLPMRVWFWKLLRLWRTRVQ